MSEDLDSNRRATFLSRRAFLEHVPALAVLPACSAIGYELRGEDREASSKSRARPTAACAACAECTARFCRYQVGGKQTAGLGSANA